MTTREPETALFDSRTDTGIFLVTELTSTGPGEPGEDTNVHFWGAAQFKDCRGCPRKVQMAANMELKPCLRSPQHGDLPWDGAALHSCFTHPWIYQ